MRSRVLLLAASLALAFVAQAQSPAPGSVESATALETPTSPVQTNKPPLRTAIVPQVIHGGVRVPLVSLATDRHQFSFAPPRSWRVQSESQRKQVRIVNPTDGAWISLSIVETPLDERSLAPEALRQRAALRFPGARILEEFSLSALDESAPAFDLESRSGAGGVLFTRFVLALFEGGCIECVLSAPRGGEAPALASFNYLLLSLRHAREGDKLKFVPVTPD